MKRFALLVALSITLSLSVLNATPNTDQKSHARSLATMKAGEKSIVKYISRGCFHSRAYSLTFTAATPMTVKIEQYTDNLDKENITKKTKRTTTLTLSTQDVSGLDKTLSYYRSHPKGGCTTSDKIGVAWYQNDKKEEYEYFVDSSCGTDSLKVLTLWDLIDRTLPKK